MPQIPDVSDAWDAALSDGCIAGPLDFVPPSVAPSMRIFGLPADPLADPLANLRRELDAFAWSLVGRLVEESDISLDRDEGSL